MSDLSPFILRNGGMANLYPTPDERAERRAQLASTPSPQVTSDATSTCAPTRAVEVAQVSPSPLFAALGDGGLRSGVSVPVRQIESSATSSSAQDETPVAVAGDIASGRPAEAGARRSQSTQPHGGSTALAPRGPVAPVPGIEQHHP